MESVLCRRLESLGYPNSTKFNADDRREFSCCVLWLEDQRIRHYDDSERDRTLRNNGAVDDVAKWEAGCLGGNSIDILNFGHIFGGNFLSWQYRPYWLQ